MRSIVNSTLLTVIPLSIAGLFFSPALNAQVTDQSKPTQSRYLLHQIFIQLAAIVRVISKTILTTPSIPRSFATI